MTKTVRTSTILLLLLSSLIWEGCGSKTPPKPSPSGNKANPQMSISEVPGMHIHAAQTTKKVSTTWSPFGVVYAASTVVTVDQNWEGRCAQNPSTGGAATIVLFGVGQSGDPNCNHEFTLGDTDGTQAASNATSGKLVYGDGTLSNLVVNTERGTQITAINGVPIKVFVRRGATVLPTPLGCTLPVGGDELICKSTATFPVLDGDRVIVTISLSGGDTLINLNAAFTKALPTTP